MWKSVSAIRKEMKEYEDRMDRGEISQVVHVLHQLNLLLAEFDSALPENALVCAMILHTMSKAALLLGEIEISNNYLDRAVQILNRSTIKEYPEQVEFFLSISERLLSVDDCNKEAQHLADVALERIAFMPEAFAIDEISEFLRRYALIAHNAGQLNAAQAACSIGLILILEMSGIQTELAKTLMEISKMNWEKGSLNAIYRIGRYLADTPDIHNSEFITNCHYYIRPIPLR